MFLLDIASKFLIVVPVGLFTITRLRSIFNAIFFPNFNLLLWQIYLGRQRVGILHKEDPAQEGKGCCLKFCYLVIFRFKFLFLFIYFPKDKALNFGSNEGESFT